MQPWLVVSGKTRIHRKVGVFLSMLALSVVFMGVLMAFIAAKVDIANGEDIRPREFLLIPLTDMLLFALFVSVGLVRYRRPEEHKRLMLASVSILPAAFARLLGSIGVGNAVLVVI